MISSLSPHVHLLITDGIFSPDRTFERFTHFDASLIERRFRADSPASTITVANVRADIVMLRCGKNARSSR